MDNDTAALLSWFREWPWAAQSGETLSDEECQAIRDVILERDAQAAEIARLTGELAARDEQVTDLLADVPCACGYDKPTDVCLKHLPRLRKAEAALAAAEARVAVLEALGAEYVLDHVLETSEERMGRHSAIRGVAVRLGCYADLEAAIDAALKGGAA